MGNATCERPPAGLRSLHLGSLSPASSSPSKPCACPSPEQPAVGNILLKSGYTISTAFPHLNGSSCYRRSAFPRPYLFVSEHSVSHGALMVMTFRMSITFPGTGRPRIPWVLLPVLTDRSHTITFSQLGPSLLVRTAAELFKVAW